MPVESFITIDLAQALFLIFLGFFGGVLSGYIGTGGAFVLTPGMMSIGAPGYVAVASNMCHKFPKALVGAMRRARIGHLDIRLALSMALPAIVGVQVGISIQEMIAERLGLAGTSLYISVAFLIVLPTVAFFCLRDVLKARRGGLEDTQPRLAMKLEKNFRIPPMIQYKNAKRTQSLWLTVPVGFATGFLAATIAVGGFIGVPSMIYIIGAPGFVASGTELGIAFVMGATGTARWGMIGAVDFRMTALILLGSLVGVQIGAVGTSYVKQYMIKLAMAVVMLMVFVSRALACPKYLHQLGWISVDNFLIMLLDYLVLLIMIAAIVTSGILVIAPMMKKRRELIRSGLLTEALVDSNPKKNAIPKTIVFGAVTIASYLLFFIYADIWTPFATGKTLMATAGILCIALYFSMVHGQFAHGILDLLKVGALKPSVYGRDTIHR